MLFSSRSELFLEQTWTPGWAPGRMAQRVFLSRNKIDLDPWLGYWTPSWVPGPESASGPAGAAQSLLVPCWVPAASCWCLWKRWNPAESLLGPWAFLGPCWEPARTFLSLLEACPAGILFGACWEPAGGLLCGACGSLLASWEPAGVRPAGTCWEPAGTLEPP